MELAIALALSSLIAGIAQYESAKLSMPPALPACGPLEQLVHEHEREHPGSYQFLPACTPSAAGALSTSPSTPGGSQ